MILPHSVDKVKSKEIYERACHYLPGGVSSPVRAFQDLELQPLIAVAGEGDLLIDADGARYIDYCGSWGALILGHAPPFLVAAVEKQLKTGFSFGLTNPLEPLLAALICRHIPSMEKLRFVCSGTEAVMSAVRLARGFTKRSAVVKFDGNYHGHVDHLLVRAGSGVASLNSCSSSKGVPDAFVGHTFSLPYNDIEQALSLLQNIEVAAVLIEPVAGNMGLVPADSPFLQMLRSETSRQGALLIFDEVISGFRVGLSGAQHIYGIRPDLTCLGKIIGGGFPVAAFGGRADVMEHLAPCGEVYQAGTLAGNPIGLRAGLETIGQLEQENFYTLLQQKANLLLDPIRQEISQRKLAACVQQMGSAFTLFLGPKEVKSAKDLAALDHPLFKRFFHYLLQQGIYFPPSPRETAFISSAHTVEHIMYTREAILKFLRQL